MPRASPRPTTGSGSLACGGRPTGTGGTPRCRSTAAGCTIWAAAEPRSACAPALLDPSDDLRPITQQDHYGDKSNDDNPVALRDLAIEKVAAEREGHRGAMVRRCAERVGAPPWKRSSRASFAGR